jgi:phosphoserine aminotransferase
VSQRLDCERFALIAEAIEQTATITHAAPQRRCRYNFAPVAPLFLLSRHDPPEASNTSCAPVLFLRSLREASGLDARCAEHAFIGRSHRAKEGLARLKEVIDRSRAVLGVPDDYRIAIVPGSDTGAVEMALWTLLGDAASIAWRGKPSVRTWVTDVDSVLRLAGARVMAAPFGSLPDLSAVDWTHDVVFTWNGTTGGVRVPDGDWIADDRTGLSICDATSAAFAMDLPWPSSM